MVLKANDRRTSCPCHDEFRGPRSDYVRQGLGSNPVEGMDACKCVVILRHGGNLNIHRVTNPFMLAKNDKGKSRKLIYNRDSSGEWSAMGQTRDIDQELGPFIAADPKLPS
ncbi:hypothetical protein TNCV_4213121 [Trichonephila clavipes]|nr:hypothetical protein TNCV_4213121 [Trichonephila clavipes]